MKTLSKYNFYIFDSNRNVRILQSNLTTMETLENNKLINSYMGTSGIDYFNIEALEKVANKIRKWWDMELGEIKIMLKTCLIYNSGHGFHVNINEGDKAKSAFIAISLFIKYYNRKARHRQGNTKRQ